MVSGGSGEGVKGKKATSRREGDCQNSISGSSSPRILSSSRGKGDGAFACSFPRDDDPPIPNSVIQQIEAVTGSKVNHHRATTTTVKTPSEIDTFTTSVADGLVSVFKLSLSECGEPKPKNVTSQPKCTKPDTNDSALRQLARQKQLEEIVDSALQLLQEHEDEQRSSGDCSVDDVGRTVLRRAGTEDLTWVYDILLRDGTAGRNAQGGKECSTGAISSIGPLALIGLSPEDVGSEGTNEDISSLASLLWGGSSVVLLLERAAAACDEPPLGCAVLTLGFSMSRGRLFRIVDMAQGAHLPRERFLEYLEAFATEMKCGLDVSTFTNTKDSNSGSSKGSQMLKWEMAELIHRYTNSFPQMKDNSKKKNHAFTEELGDPVSPIHLQATASLLQSVKEEENEEEDEDQVKEEVVANDESSRGESLRGHDKPSKRTRVA